MELFHLLRRRPWGIIGAVILILIVLITIFTPLISPYSPNEMSFETRLQSPGGSHIMGTDNLGRDVFSRLLYGTRPYVLTALIATGISLVVSLLLGCILPRSKNDSWLRILLNILAVLAGVLILIIVMRLVYPYLSQFIAYMRTDGQPTMFGALLFASLLISFLMLPAMYNSMRTTLTSKWSRDSLHYSLTTILVGFGISIGLALAVISSLSYLGVGVPPPIPEWGGYISGTGRQYAITAPWIALYTKIAIGVTLLGAILFSVTTYDIWLPKVNKTSSKSTASH